MDKRHAVIVDDEPLVAMVIAAWFEDSDWSSATYPSGVQLNDELDRIDALDLLVTDIRMPGLDGIALAQLVREKFPAAAVLYTSGHLLDIEQDRVPHAVFLAKPFLLSDLEEKIDAALKLATSPQRRFGDAADRNDRSPDHAGD